MIGALLPLLLVLAVLGGAVVLGAVLLRRLGSPGARGSAGHAVRRFFQYLLLLGLLVAASSGVSGLVGRALDPGTTLQRDDAGLALQLTFTFIALPLWVALAVWTDRRLRRDPDEPRSPGWAVYLTLVSLIALVVAMVAWHSTLQALLGSGDYRGPQLAAALVWTLVWAAHRWWHREQTPETHLRTERLLGSLIGLVTTVVGATGLLAASLRELLGLGGQTLFGGPPPLLADSAAVLLVGAAAWAAYWLLGTLRARRSTGWLVLVLLVGVAGGLLMPVVAASVLGWDVLVWLVGDPQAATASEHFDELPGLLATTLIGLVVWWYHREVLGADVRGGRSEVRRVYEYALAAVGLLAAGAGLVMVLVTLVEAITAGSDLVGGSAVNALLAALVLLAVGLPVWWWHWRQAQRARAAGPAQELASPTRRTYLLVLFGLMGVTAVVALLVLVYQLLQDGLAGGVDLETVRAIRFPLGILATASLLSAYHWTVFRTDRADGARLLTPGAPGGRAARSVLLVGTGLGPSDAAELGRAAGAAVLVLSRTDREPVPASLEAVAAALADAPADDLIVLVSPDGLQVVPVSFPGPLA